MEELAIKIEHVSKQYRLGAIGGGTLKGDLQSWWARVRGQEDPNSKIGSDQNVKIGERFLALDDINLEVKKGEAVGIIGHNGAGKSTLLKLLSRVTAPTEGKISINGRIASMLEVGTGFHPEMTGRENVYLNGAILGMTKAEIDKKFDEIVEFSEVAKFIDTPVKRYSSGMYVKLAFSVAAHLDSEIMIMDEVLAVGDMKFQKKCLDKMRSAAKEEGRTVLYVSHNMNTIRQLCDRCIVMDHGHIIYNGDVDEAIQLYLGIKMKSGNIVSLEDMHRDPEFSDHPITMKTIEAMNSKDSIFSVGAILTMQITAVSSKPFPNVFLRLIVKTVEGAPVTMIPSDHGISFPEGEDVTVEFSLDVSKLVPGKYTVSPVLFEVNEYGGNNFLDGLKDVYCFEIVETNGFNHNMVWQPRYWGYHYTDPIMLEKVR